MIPNNPGDMYPGKIMMLHGIDQRWIVYVGFLAEHLYCVVSDGTTFRLDKFFDKDEGRNFRKWTEIAKIPLESKK